MEKEDEKDLIKTDDDGKTSNEEKADNEKENRNYTESNEERKENKLLKKVLIGMGMALILVLGFIWGINSTTNFEYEGLKFTMIKEGSLIFYNVEFPLYSPITGKSIGGYNFYIRNDPRKLKQDIPFYADLMLKKNVVLESHEEFNCEGDGIIAIANLLNLEIFGEKIIRDENATCDNEGRYTYINLKSGNKSYIDQDGPSCYTLYINNCEILEVTERLLVESLVNLQDEKLYAKKE